MIFINFSTFCKTIGKIKTNVNSNSAFVVRMFKAIEHPHFLKCDDNDNYAGKLYSGNKPFTQALRDKTVIPFKIGKSYSFFKKYLDRSRCNILYKDLSIDNLHSLDFEVLSLALAFWFEAFCTLDESQIKNFEEYYQLALSNPTLVESRDIKPNDVDYILEMNLQCPICGEPLIYDYKGINYSNYKITEIFPSDLPLSKTALFKSISVEPKDKTLAENKIAVCKRHYDLYHSIFAEEDFSKLLDQKTKAKYLKLIKKATDDSDLKDRIINTLSNVLKFQKDGKLAKLSLEALHISNKIPKFDVMTYSIVLDLIINYYQTIDNYFKKYEAKFEDGSTVFSKKIKALSNYYMNDLHYSPGRLIRELASNLDSLLPNELKDEISCLIIVCYFVQHCEVLSDEIS